MNETTTQQNETTQNNTVDEFLKTWNPTQPDAPDPRNEYIAQRIFGMVACPGWNYINFGSAGGAALMKACTHENGKCYPAMTTGNMNGKVGGCPDFLKNWPPCKDLIDYWRTKGYTVSVDWNAPKINEDGKPTKVVARIQGIMAYGTTAEEAITEVSIKAHKILDKEEIVICDKCNFSRLASELQEVVVDGHAEYWCSQCF